MSRWQATSKRDVSLCNMDTTSQIWVGTKSRKALEKTSGILCSWALRNEMTLTRHEHKWCKLKDCGLTSLQYTVQQPRIGFTNDQGLRVREITLKGKNEDKLSYLLLGAKWTKQYFEIGKYGLLDLPNHFFLPSLQVSNEFILPRTPFGSISALV